MSIYLQGSIYLTPSFRPRGNVAPFRSSLENLRKFFCFSFLRQFEDVFVRGFKSLNCPQLSLCFSVAQFFESAFLSGLVLIVLLQSTNPVLIPNSLKSRRLVSGSQRQIPTQKIARQRPYGTHRTGQSSCLTAPL